MRAQRQDVRPLEAVRRASRAGVGAWAEARVDAVRHYRHPLRRYAQSADQLPRANSDTVITSRARRAIAGSSRR